MADKTVEQVIEWARWAKGYMRQANNGPLPSDETILRASWTFLMLVRSGVIVEKDDLDRPHSIATIASNFADVPPNTPQRAALFSMKL